MNITPQALKELKDAEKLSKSQGLTLATLCDMVLGEDASNRSDEALIRAVRNLIEQIGEGLASDEQHH